MSPAGPVMGTCDRLWGLHQPGESVGDKFRGSWLNAPGTGLVLAELPRFDPTTSPEDPKRLPESRLMLQIFFIRELCITGPAIDNAESIHF
jgi:hypothetical protein